MIKALKSIIVKKCKKCHIVHFFILFLVSNFTEKEAEDRQKRKVVHQYSKIKRKLSRTATSSGDGESAKPEQLSVTREPKYVRIFNIPYYLCF